MAEGDVAVLTKLEIIKEIRSRTLTLEKLRSKMKQEIDLAEKEDKCLAEYRNELEILQQEKTEHVEMLRLIHSDINMMESIVKQSDNEYKHTMEKMRRLLADYQPLKQHIDELRAAVGLGKLNDSDIEAASLNLESMVSSASCSMKRRSEDPVRPVGLVPSAASSSSPDADMVVLNGGLLSAAAVTSDAEEGSESRLRVRQQLPPMKFCSSCHQQIHRNAPICPLCKAKSHSRNPKKGRKKE